MELLLATMLGVGCTVLAWAVYRAVANRPAKRMEEWQEQVEGLAIVCIRKDMDAALAKAALVSKIGELPATFDPTCFLTCHIAAGVHRATLAEAERLGLIRPGMASEIYAEAMPPQQDEQRTPSVPPPSVRFVNGRLLPR